MIISLAVYRSFREAQGLPDAPPPTLLLVLIPFGCRYWGVICHRVRDRRACFRRRVVQDSICRVNLCLNLKAFCFQHHRCGLRPRLRRRRRSCRCSRGRRYSNRDGDDLRHPALMCGMHLDNFPSSTRKKFHELAERAFSSIVVVEHLYTSHHQYCSFSDQRVDVEDTDLNVKLVRQRICRPPIRQ